MPKQDYLIEQYKILWTSLNGEMQRFWTRFNILIGFQILIAAGLLNVDFDSSKKYLLYNSTDDITIVQNIVFFVLAIIAFSVWRIVVRAIKIYKLQINSIIKLEAKHPKLILLTEIGKDTQNELKNPRAYDWALVIIILMFFIWTILLLVSLLNMIYK